MHTFTVCTQAGKLDCRDKHTRVISHFQMQTTIQALRASSHANLNIHSHTSSALKTFHATVATVEPSALILSNTLFNL